MVLEQNLGQIWPNVVKKVKKQVLSTGFFHILHGQYLLKQKVVVVHTPERKFKANTGSEISHFGDNDLLLLQFRPGGNDSKNCLEHFRESKVNITFLVQFFGYLTRSTVILKLNSFKGWFNQTMFYDFQNVCQGKVVVKIF